MSVENNENIPAINVHNGVRTLHFNLYKGVEYDANTCREKLYLLSHSTMSPSYNYY